MKILRNPVGVLTLVGIPLFASVGYGTGVIQAAGRAKRVKSEADLHAIRTAIQQYRIEEGRFPNSLDDLSVVQDQGIDPDLYVYDSTTGRVQLR